MGKLDDPKLEGKLLLLAGDFAITLLLTAGTALSVLSGYRLDTDGRSEEHTSNSSHLQESRLTGYGC